MRESNIKDKLDHIPQPFDRDALWDRITGDQPIKRKPILWLWLAPFIILLVAIGYLWNQETELTSLPIQSNTISKSEKSIIEKDELNIISFNEEATTEATNNEAFYSVIETNKKIAIDAKDLKNKTSNVIREVDVEKINNENIPNQIKAVNIKRTTHNQLNTNVTRNPNYINQFINNHSPSSPITPIHEQASTRKLSTANANTNSADNSKRFSPKLTIMQQLFTKNSLIKIDNRTIDAMFMDIPKKLILDTNSKWMTSLYINYGQENHDFAEGRNIVGTETELEAIGLGFNIDRILCRWTVGLGVNHTIGNTYLDHNASSYKYLEGLTGGIVSESKNTQYNLYNNYHRTDLSIGLGYQFPLWQKLHLNINTTVGTKIYSATLGDYFVSENELASLEYRSDFNNNLGLYGTVGLDLQYQLGKKLAIGLGLNLQTTRSYDDDHKITPSYAQVKIMRLW